MLVNMIQKQHLGNQLGIEPTAYLLKDLFVNNIHEWEGLHSYGFQYVQDGPYCLYMELRPL